MGVENSRPKSTDLDNYRAVPAPVSCPVCGFTPDLIPTPPATPRAEPLESKCFAEISHLTKPPTISSSPISSSQPEDEVLRNGEPATSIELKSFTATLSPTPPSLSPPTSSPASEILSFDSLLRTYSSYPHPEKEICAHCIPQDAWTQTKCQIWLYYILTTKASIEPAIADRHALQVIEGLGISGRTVYRVAKAAWEYVLGESDGERVWGLRNLAPTDAASQEASGRDSWLE